MGLSRQPFGRYAVAKRNRTKSASQATKAVPRERAQTHGGSWRQGANRYPGQLGHACYGGLGSQLGLPAEHLTSLAGVDRHTQLLRELSMKGKGHHLLNAQRSLWRFGPALWSKASAVSVARPGTCRSARRLGGSLYLRIVRGSGHASPCSCSETLRALGAG